MTVLWYIIFSLLFYAFFHKVFFPFVTCVIFALFLFSFMYKGQSMGIITERKCFFISYEKQNDHKIFIFHVGKILIANFFQFYHSYLKKKFFLLVPDVF